MFLKLIRLLALISALAVTLFGVAACSDSESDNDIDAGDAGEDSGTPSKTPDTGTADSGKDSATKTDAGKCGECESVQMMSVTLPGCCIEATGKCGLDMDALKQLDPNSPMSGCMERDRPGVASDHCTSFFDQVDGTANGKFDQTSSSGTLQMPGCCTPAGECGLSFTDAKLDMGNGGTPIDLNFRLGCIGYNDLPGEEEDAGNSLEMDKLPFCNPKTGAAPTEGTIKGVPQFVCGCGEDVAYDDEVQALPCLSHLKKSVCGADKVDDATMKEIPVFVCGCGASTLWGGSGLPCLNNLEKTSCGTKAADSAGLADVPEYVCGCGENELGTGSCLAHVPKATCGGLAVASGTVPGAPEYACGCGDGVIAAGCIPNVPASVCGADAFSGTAVPDVPEYACGCGDGAIAAGCIPNIPANVCGAQEVTSGTVPGVPEYACGCGDDVLASGCIPNVPSTVCGADAFSGTAVPGVPEYACGCGEGVVIAGCIPNVPANVCGAQEVTSGPIGGLAKIACGCGDDTIGERCIPNVPANVCGADDPDAADLAAVPDFLCGCGVDVLAAGRPCMNNVATSVCGTQDVDPVNVAYLPALLCGCGADATYDPANAVNAVYPCLSKQPATSCGGKTVDITAASGSAAACITGVKAYARGCGTDQNAGAYPPTCVPHADATLWGCDQPADGLVVPFQPKYACGCGVGVFTGSCIPNVGINVCGDSDPTSGQLAAIPEYVCGCQSDPFLRTTCLRNIPVTTCGTLETTVSTRDLDGDTNTTGDTVSCLVGLVEYAHGCGNAAGPSALDPTCLRNAGDPTDGHTTDILYGCVDIPAVTTSIVGIPEYLCGCGQTATTDANTLPCLAYVGLHGDTTPICGAVPITASAQVNPAIPNNVCGCGDGVPSPAPCLDNVPESACGAKVLCTPIGSQGNCDADKTCRDLHGGAGAGTGGLGGAGDGIGDTCQTNT